MIFAGMFIAVCAMLPLVLFHMSAPAMALAVLGGAATGFAVFCIIAVVFMFLFFHD